jgi:hypothetical protein
MGPSEMARLEEEQALPVFESVQGQQPVFGLEGTPAVGDLRSQAKGTGARYNAGKPPVELLLWTQVAERYDGLDSEDPVVKAMWHLGAFQQSHDPGHLVSLIHALYEEDHYTHHIDTDAASVFGYGAKKYAAWNWAKGMQWSVPVGCIGRHLLAILWGEENDKESGLPHRGHIGCNVMMLQHYAKHYTEGNDLPPRELFT